MNRVLADSKHRDGREDGTAYSYESFLAVHDPAMRKARGVYFTPEPVALWIVRSVDKILQTKFGLKDGLADSSQILLRAPMRDAHSRRRRASAEKHHRVMIFDPAAGTGIFLHKVIQQIHETWINKRLAGAWNDYVSRDLLPRVFGLELLPEPCAIALVRLKNLLAETGFTFASGDHLRVYPGNTLEEKAPPDLQGLPPFASRDVAQPEAAPFANEDQPILVIVGNPPYSNFGMTNKGAQISRLLEDYKRGLAEKKLNLDDDFIKFIRWAQWRIERTGAGVIGMITSNTFLDGLTHRRMRESLMETFTDIYLLDLHGASKKKETCPDGSKDENVFDIQQGVAISIFCKTPGVRKKTARIHHADLWGLREAKFDFLANTDLESVKWKRLTPQAPDFFFVPRPLDSLKEYASWPSLKDIFPVNQNGFKTDRDDLFFDFDRRSLEKRMKAFYSAEGLSAAFRERYRVTRSSSYDLPDRRRRTAFDPANIRRCLYRPFDGRWVYYAPGLTSRPAWEIMKHILQGDNLALAAMRQYQYRTPEFCYALASDQITECRVFVSNRGIANVFPLYLYPDEGADDCKASNGDAPDVICDSGKGRKPNLASAYIDHLSACLSLSFTSEGKGDLKRTVGPEDVFHYIYAVLHAPSYRCRHAEMLKIGYPRIPPPASLRLFRRLCKLGSELIALHLMRGRAAAEAIPPLMGKGRRRVEAVRFEKARPAAKAGRVRINTSQYFDRIPEAVWRFQIGGYQVCLKWLKDRKGRELTLEEIGQYRQIIGALSGTLRTMKAINKALAGNGAL
ncbi:MAG: N-6 DNA methylase [Candidatus Sumerlaeota bacterium]|nr:N-6 DNA methylase [Candidatus Sumerlaeota bacterium]